VKTLVAALVGCVLISLLPGCRATQAPSPFAARGLSADFTAALKKPSPFKPSNSSANRQPDDTNVAESKPERISELQQTAGNELPSSDSLIQSSGSIDDTEGMVADTSGDSLTTPIPSDAAYALTLPGILQLADAQNPNVAAARERINEAYARVERAEALWLPSVRAGLNYNHHEGAIQDVAGNVFQTNRSAFGGGLGANMYGAASPGVPGLLAQFHLSDAIFQPKIASHQAVSRQFGATAARNDILRDASVAYLELVRTEHGVAIAIETLQNTERLYKITREYAKTGEGLESDYQRMETELAIRQEELTAQQEAAQVASARLAQILHADPACPIRSGEPVVTPLEIMAIDGSAASYVVLGLSRRPELAEQKHLVCEAVERLNREKYAPLVPSVLLGLSYGGMGGGLGTSIVNSAQRWDADAVAFWELRNMGVGDRAARNEAASVARQQQMREVAALDRVAREVTEAHTQVIQRKRRLEQAQKSIASAMQSYDLNLQRIENGKGLPIEVLQSIQALASARRAYLNAVIDYNVAQFELSRATGWFVES
jgi:outer membrane protein TolC